MRIDCNSCIINVNLCPSFSDEGVYMGVKSKRPYLQVLIEQSLKR